VINLRTKPADPVFGPTLALQPRHRMLVLRTPPHGRTVRRRPARQTLLLLGLVAFLVRGQAQTDERRAAVEPPRQDFRWEPLVQMDNNLFPSAIIATANLHLPAREKNSEPAVLGNPTGWVGIMVVCPHDGAQVSVRIKCRQLMEESGGDFILPHRGKVYQLHPEVAWDFDGLRTNQGAKPETISFAVSLDGSAPDTKTRRVLVRSINDCVTGSIENGRYVDFPYIFPAYVNEDHPWVIQILDEAKKSGTIREFSGYQSHKTQDVYNQVYAIWNVLQRRGLTYSSITTVAPSSNKVFSQEVRFLEQSIATTQANCVDGSVLFASILRKIGIDPFLVLIPGHMFMGFYLEPEHKQTACLETTLMGKIDLRKFPEDHTLTGGMTKILGADTKNSASWKTFAAAIGEGARKYKASLPHMEQHESNYAVIEISAARRLGILPIAYTADTK